MLNISAAKSPTLRTLDLIPGVTVDVADMLTEDLILARAAAREVYAAAGTPEGAEPSAETRVRAAFAMNLTLAQRLVRAWSGVGDGQDEPVEPTPENVSSAMSLPAFYEAMEGKVLGPAFTRIAEGNGSANSRAGTLETAPAASTATAAG